MVIKRTPSESYKPISVSLVFEPKVSKLISPGSNDPIEIASGTLSPFGSEFILLTSSASTPSKSPSPSLSATKGFVPVSLLSTKVPLPVSTLSMRPSLSVSSSVGLVPAVTSAPSSRPSPSVSATKGFVPVSVESEKIPPPVSTPSNRPSSSESESSGSVPDAISASLNRPSPSRSVSVLLAILSLSSSASYCAVMLKSPEISLNVLSHPVNTQ